MYEDGEAEWMIAFDPDTGQEKWRFEFARPYPGHDGSYDGPISTPVIVENTVIGLGPYGRLFAVDTVDGEPIWSIDLVEDLGAAVPIYGFGTSPIVVDGTLVVQVGAESGAIAGFDPRTGEKRWIAGEDAMRVHPGGALFLSQVVAKQPAHQPLHPRIVQVDDLVLGLGGPLLGAPDLSGGLTTVANELGLGPFQGQQRCEFHQSLLVQLLVARKLLHDEVERHE